MIDKSKTYKTVDEDEVRIYATDAGGKYPVHGAIKINGEWRIEDWDAEGRYEVTPDINDLVEQPETVEVPEYWVIVYRNGDLGLMRLKPNPMATDAKIVHVPAHTAEVVG